MSSRWMKHLNRLAIKINFFLSSQVGVGGPSAFGIRLLTRRRPTHPVKNILMRDDLDAVRSSFARGVDQRHFASRAAAGFRQRLIPTNMIGVHMRIDDVVDRLVGQCTYCRSTTSSIRMCTPIMLV